MLCGAEAAMVVNNNAAAVLLVLAAIARDRQVVVSRGESVEIGGGFPIPDVMEQSGAHLVDVGTTNRTRLADYRAASPTDADVAVCSRCTRRTTASRDSSKGQPSRQLAQLGGAGRGRPRAAG